jgi:2-isopropylmalate synthase
MEYKLRMTREQVLASIAENVAYAKSFCEDIEFSAEDASRSDREFLARATRSGQGRCTVLNVPDTVATARRRRWAI